ncbi:MAG: hypothetical protein WBA92_08020, partial [Pseudorhodobacter sp.]
PGGMSARSRAGFLIRRKQKAVACMSLPFSPFRGLLIAPICFARLSLPFDMDAMGKRGTQQKFSLHQNKILRNTAYQNSM